jgi:hypothetical protein
VYVVPPTVWGEGALIEFVEPSITVRVNVVVELELPTVSWRPVGELWNVRTTVRGSRRTVSVSERPPESVAVRVSSR